MGVDEFPGLIKRSPRTRGGENRIRLLRPHVCDKPPQVVLKFPTSIGKYLLVVVRKLDDHPIAGLQRLDQLLPPPLGEESACASPVCGVIDDHRWLLEELRQKLPPAVLG